MKSVINLLFNFTWVKRNYFTTSQAALFFVRCSPKWLKWKLNTSMLDIWFVYWINSLPCKSNILFSIFCQVLLGKPNWKHQSHFYRGYGPLFKWNKSNGMTFRCSDMMSFCVDFCRPMAFMANDCWWISASNRIFRPCRKQHHWWRYCSGCDQNWERNWLRR